MYALVPKTGWQGEVSKMRCGARNDLRFTLKPPTLAPNKGCWLVPTCDSLAVRVAEQADSLRALGWQLVTCEARLVEELGCKAGLKRFAQRHGLLRHLPQYYDSPEECSFPCVAKSASGVYGKECYIVHSAVEAHAAARKAAERHAARDGAFWGSRWVLQEYVMGRHEFSTSLLVSRGEVLDAICSRYEYDAEEYVWPRVSEVEEKRAFPPVPAAHLQVMKAFVAVRGEEYSGILNFNYKIRPSGDTAIF